MRPAYLALLLIAAACSSAGSFEMTAMTFNVRYGTADDGPDAWPLRRELAFDVLRRGAPDMPDTPNLPDVIGMQEVLAFQREEFLSACPGYTAVGVAREADGSGEASPILFRSDRFRSLESGTFWLSETPDLAGSRGWDAALPRICTWVLLEESGGGCIWVFNVHFDHVGALARLESAKLVAARIAARKPRHPALFLGDLNAGEGSPPVQAFDDLVDTFRALHPEAIDVGTFHGFRGGTKGEKIDYVFVSPDVEVLAAGIVRVEPGSRLPSDHYPVTARLRIP